MVRRIRLPFVPGFDVAGDVVELGPGVTSYKVGDRVHARLEHAVGAASAEFSIAGLNVVTKMPSQMTFADAAALPLAGMTALQGLRDHLQLPLSGARRRVLIVGASGGVGHLAVQLARTAGAFVVGVSSTRNLDLVGELGADEVIDYTKPTRYREQAPFDAIFDCVGGAATQWFHMLAPYGRLATPVPTGGLFLSSLLNPFRGRTCSVVMLKSNAADLAYLDHLYEQSKLRVVIDSRFPLERLNEAWQRSLSGRAVGKIVVDIG
jgi:NADPH:quinone reductase-like Zn-dependent oxidoreductase